MSILCMEVSSLSEPNIGVLSNRLQSFIDEYSLSEDEDIEDTHVLVSNSKGDSPFRAWNTRHVIISLSEANEIAGYAGIKQVEYLELCASLVFVQRKALVENPCLIQDDFNHPSHSEASLFDFTKKIQEYAHAVDSRRICKLCREFYRRLKCERELDRLAAYIQTLERDSKFAQNAKLRQFETIFEYLKSKK
jgi:hypothetical protein